MSACNFEFLLQFVNRQLDLDKQLEVYNHLDRCDICREAVGQISRDLDGSSLNYCAHCGKPYSERQHIEAAEFKFVQMSANLPIRVAARRSINRP